jgi:hypothetical protein
MLAADLFIDKLSAAYKQKNHASVVRHLIDRTDLE